MRGGNLLMRNAIADSAGRYPKERFGITAGEVVAYSALRGFKCHVSQGRAGGTDQGPCAASGNRAGDP